MATRTQTTLLAASLLVACGSSTPPLHGTAIAQTGVAANGTTLPFQRHVVWLSTHAGTRLVAALQQQGSDKQGLSLFESDDDGQSWRRTAALQPDFHRRDVADVLPDADRRGFWLVYGVEPESSKFGPYVGTDVVLLHEKLDASDTLAIDVAPQTVFAPRSSSWWFRPAIARDPAGVLHVTATEFDERGNSAWQEVTTTDGATFTAPVVLATASNTFLGGREIGCGATFIAVYGTYDEDSMGAFSRSSDGSGGWHDPVVAVPEGIHHAGAFSLACGSGPHVELGYSTKGSQQLRHRSFDGAAWSAATNIDLHGMWSNQPALVTDGDDVWFGWNHENGDGTMQLRVMARHQGRWAEPVVLSAASTFKGYTSAMPDRAPSGRLHLFWSEQAVQNQPPAYLMTKAFEP